MTSRDLQAALAWSSLPWVGERTFLALLDHAREGRRGLADLWESSPDDLQALVKLHPKARAALETQAAERWSQAAAEMEAIRSWGVDLLLAGEPDYPTLQGAFARKWPRLFAYGALDLLDEPRISIVNSRTVSNSALAATDSLADALARRDVPLVSSINKEAYQAAATAAKRHAGPSLMVLDRGVAEAFPSGLTREPIAPARVWDARFDPDLQLILSPCGWKEHWNQRSGPRRDALIIDLAAAIVAVDVRPGGTMEQECMRAAQEGKAVFILDRGDRTDPAARRLWEEVPGIRRLPWRGADEAADAVLSALPGERAALREDRSEPGRLRDIAHFLARACATLSGGHRAAVAAFPTTGPFAEAARSWSRQEADATTGAALLLANLTGGDHAPSRPAQLLDRVAPGGLLALLTPGEWITDEGFALIREQWLRKGALRLAVSLPMPTAGDAGPGAALILQRDGREGRPALTFAPEQRRMGRFHLRRYLAEVAAKLQASP